MIRLFGILKERMKQIISIRLEGEMIYLIGEKKYIWYYGDKYIFERIAKGEWKCIYQENPLIPYDMIQQLGN